MRSIQYLLFGKNSKDDKVFTNNKIHVCDFLICATELVTEIRCTICTSLIS